MDEVTCGGGVDCGEDGADFFLEDDGFFFVAEGFLLVFGNGFPVHDVLEEDAADGADHPVHGGGHLTEFVFCLVGEFLTEITAGDSVEDFCRFLDGCDDPRGDGAGEENDEGDDDDQERGHDEVCASDDGAGVCFAGCGEVIGFVDELEDCLEVALVEGAELFVEDGLGFLFLACFQSGEEGGVTELEELEGGFGCVFEQETFHFGVGHVLVPEGEARFEVLFELVAFRDDCVASLFGVDVEDFHREGVAFEDVFWRGQDIGLEVFAESDDLVAGSVDFDVLKR